MAVLLLGAPIDAKRKLEEELARVAELHAIDHNRLIRTAAVGEAADGEVRRHVAAGKEIPDEVQVRVLEKHLLGVGNLGKVLLTNFPKTPRQGVLLDEMLAKRAGSVGCVVWVEMSEGRLAKHLVESGRVDQATAEAKAATFTRNAVALKIFYAERGILRRVSGNLGPEELLRDARRAIGQG